MPHKGTCGACCSNMACWRLGAQHIWSRLAYVQNLEDCMLGCVIVECRRISAGFQTLDSLTQAFLEADVLLAVSFPAVLRLDTAAGSPRFTLLPLILFHGSPTPRRFVHSVSLSRSVDALIF
ncbi:unnamed protein product [Prorocentrum cordatum]|uniref:Uncharacterized protein n=1 Tax=Prorocentrum cordatum TaxID=2364126 RepID=A0ABN9RYG4_9DINO|nr:unnamed protein product [Polarella glacialis]